MKYFWTDFAGNKIYLEKHFVMMCNHVLYDSDNLFPFLSSLDRLDLKLPTFSFV